MWMSRSVPPRSLAAKTAYKWPFKGFSARETYSSFMLVGLARRVSVVQGNSRWGMSFAPRGVPRVGTRPLGVWPAFWVSRVRMYRGLPRASTMALTSGVMDGGVDSVWPVACLVCLVKSVCWKGLSPRLVSPVVRKVVRERVVVGSILEASGRVRLSFWFWAAAGAASMSINPIDRKRMLE